MFLFDSNVNTSSPVGSSFKSSHVGPCNVISVFSSQDPPLITSFIQFVGPTLSWLHVFLQTSINWQWSSAISTDEDEDFKLFPNSIFVISVYTVWPFFLSFFCFFCSYNVIVGFLTDFTWALVLLQRLWKLLQIVAGWLCNMCSQQNGARLTSLKGQFRRSPTYCWWNLLLCICVETLVSKKWDCMQMRPRVCGGGQIYVSNL